MRSPASKDRVMAAASWGSSSVAERSNLLLKIADRIEANLKTLAYVETWDNGKPIRETMAADIPLSVDHFRYFAGVLRAQEGSMSEIDHDTVAYHFHEPLGVVGQIIPWNFSVLMAAWKLAPALAAGNCIVLKPAEQTPAAILEKIIAYEAVHQIDSWEELRRRVDPPDRRCFAFFHPSMPDEPLIFVEVALTGEIPGSIQALLAPDRPALAPEQAKTAVCIGCRPGAPTMVLFSSM